MAALLHLTYHLDLVRRSEGRSAVQTAAYASRQRLFDVRLGITHDHHSAREDLAHAEILAPAGAPDWVYDREELWNRAEAAERYKNAQVARRGIVALPNALDRDQQLALAREHLGGFVRMGMVADFAIHHKDGNDHLHFQLTMREIGPDGFAKKKATAWNAKALLIDWRGQYEEQCNRYLDAAGVEDRVSTKSFRALGIDRTPTRHLGYQASRKERKGERTDKGEYNREARFDNALSDMLDLHAPEPITSEPATTGAAQESGFFAALGSYLSLTAQRSTEMALVRTREWLERAWDSATSFLDRLMPGRGQGHER